MSNQTQQQKQNWVKKDPNALSKPKYCTGECGNYMYWDPTAEKASSGKMIPQDVLTGNKHDCPRNSRSPNYDPNLQAVPEPEDVPGFVIDAYNKRKKEHKERLAGQTVIPPPSEEETPVGQYTERQHNEIIAMHGLTQKFLGEIRDYLEVLVRRSETGPSLVYQPSGMLNNLNEEFKKNEKVLQPQPVVEQQQQMSAGPTTEGGGEAGELQDVQDEKDYQEYVKEMEERKMA